MVADGDFFSTKRFVPLPPEEPGRDTCFDFMVPPTDLAEANALGEDVRTLGLLLDDTLLDETLGEALECLVAGALELLLPGPAFALGLF